MVPKKHTVHKGVKAPFPKGVEPMLATLVKEPFDDDQWLFEVKFDGYRITAYLEDGRIILRTRGLLDYTKYYPAVADALGDLKHDVVLDGEIVVLNSQGIPDFDALQAYKGEGTLVYYVFDVLWSDGYDLTGLPLTERKEILKKILPVNQVIRYSDGFDSGVALYDKATQIGLEGVVAKRKDSIYISSKGHKRTKYWLKIPTAIIQEFVIGGWTESGSGRAFRSVLFGAYKDHKLLCVGHAGSGYKEAEMKALLKKLASIEVKKNPFSNAVETETTPHWVKPILVGRFRFATWTKAGKIRKPAIFLGLREDKPAMDVVWEEPVKMINPEAAPVKRKKGGHIKPRTTMDKKGVMSESNWPELERMPVTSRETVDMGSCSIELTNVEKELWPHKNLTKAALIQYYHSISRYILPHLMERPLSLHVKPYSPTAPGLYIKDMEGRQPDCAKIFTTQRKHPKAGKRAQIDYLVCNNLPTLIYLINLGCIDINPWTARTTSPKHPDYIVIDLDPSDQDFKKAIVTANAAKQLFDSSKLTAFVKTSGKTGIHMVLPCLGFTFVQARKIAERICQDIHFLVPGLTTTEVSVNRRGVKLYIDPNQNDEADTIASAYSVRPFREPNVSTPLRWQEIKETLDPSDFNIESIVRRLEKKGDLWEKVLDKKIASANAKQLQELFL